VDSNSTVADYNFAAYSNWSTDIYGPERGSNWWAVTP
jgi:hypothetical protein